MPAPSRAFDDGQCATPVRGLAEAAHLALVEVDAVGEPDVVAEPAELLEVLDRAHAEQLEAELLLVLASRPCACAAERRAARVLGGLAHQLLA